MFCFLQMAKKSAKSAKSARKNISLIDLNRIVRLNIMYCIVLYCQAERSRSPPSNWSALRLRSV
jgi:hypothetical protein